jgi:hypothetical protein
MIFGHDTPLRLDAAAKIAFPDGSMKESGLRREAKRGRLVIERVAGKDYTTLGHINRMRELCRLEAKAPASISGARDAMMPMAASRTRQSGSSAMVATNEARAALRMILAEPSDASPSISPGSTNER